MTKEIMYRTRFAGIKEGDYEKPFHTVLASLLSTEQRHVRVRGALIGKAKPEDHQGFYSLTYKSARTRAAPSKDGMDYLIGAKEPETEDIFFPAAKPQDVNNLEKILSEAFQKTVSITRVKDLAAHRKQSVKEVSYSTGDGAVYKVWVFKADPLSTVKELNIYYIAHQAGVPTGMPIAYTPLHSAEKYPFDMAILGGVINYAGVSYDELVKDLPLEPRMIFNTALAVTGIIADYHVKLTLAEKEFKDLGIEIPRFDVEKEIKERFVAAIGVDPENVQVKSLVTSCRRLDKNGSPRVISHNDLHTGNIITLSQTNPLGQIGSSYQRFGVIDWGEIAWDSPYGDLLDFWLHHKRLAQQVCTKYSFRFEKLESAYRDKFNQLGALHNLSFERKEEKSVVKSAIWNLLEIYDPSRNQVADIIEKATRHSQALWQDLAKLKDFGYAREAYQIKKSINELLKDREYLQPILNS